MNEKRICLLVLGMHRSGTSALARLVNVMGADFPKQMVGPGVGNESGHFEPERLVALNNMILAEAGSYSGDFRRLDLSRMAPGRVKYFFDRVKVIIMDDFDESKLFILKDPRICRFVASYVRLLAQMEIAVSPIIPYRNPLEVADSLAARDDMMKVTSLLLWLRHVLDAENGTRGLTRSFVNYDRLVSSGSEALRDMEQQLGIAWPRRLEETSAEIDKAVRRDLRHHKRDPCELKDGEWAVRWISHCFAALEILAVDPRSETAMQMLDEIAAEIDNATASLAVYRTHCDQYKSELEDAKRELEYYRSNHVSELAPLAGVEYRGAIALKRRKLWPYVRNRIRRIFGVKPVDVTDVAAYFDLDAYVRANPGLIDIGDMPALHFISSGTKHVPASARQ